MSEGKDWIVTVWVPFNVRIENAEDMVSAKYRTQDYLDLVDPLTGTDTLPKILGRASDPTVFTLRMEEGLIMSAEIPDDSLTYPEVN